MFSRNNYWIFFAILSVGLVMSWGQVGKEALLTKGKQLSVMNLEEDCRPLNKPCAAYAKGFALVLGAISDKHFRLLGQQLPENAEISLLHLDDASKKIADPQLRYIEGSRWLITPTALVGRLRINIEIDDRQWVTEFPLR